MSKKVELKLLLKLFNIFVNKKWTKIDGYENVLNRFGELIYTLKEEEIELILDLIEKYYWLTYNDYNTSLRNLLKKLQEDSLKDKKKLYIFPVIKPIDEDKIKSGHAVMYMLDSIKPSIDEFSDIEFILLKKFEDIKEEKFNLTENDFLILVDDYIGSGNTLTKTLVEIDKNKSIKGNFAILTVAIQEGTKSLLNEQKIKYYNYLSLKKGITDYYTSPDLEEKLTIMKKIEDKIPKIKKYRLGYEKSEALITLIKTPNNTFPIFWKASLDKQKEIKAPFQRK